MDRFVVYGGRRLRGTARVNGSKNAALPILIATLLTDEPCVVENVPRLRDIRTTVRLLEILGKRVTPRGRALVVERAEALRHRAPYEVVKEMRASVLVAGPLLARLGRARVPLPGGCAIGLRPVDIHVDCFKAFGAECRNEGGDLVLNGRRLHPARIRLRFPSVGATENALMTAASLEGSTVVENAAREPEIADLAEFLRKMGARVSGDGTSRIAVEGSRLLRGVRHRVIPDRLEAGTLLLACAAAGGTVTLRGAEPGHLSALLKALAKSGALVRAGPGRLRIEARGRPAAVSVITEPHPGFPTDLQPLWMAYMTLARGSSRIREDIFERRFLHAAELARLGARVSFHGNAVTVTGVPALQGAGIMASDIRAGAALVVAALAAQGRTEIHRIYHIDRGYESLERKLRRLGARIRRAR
jgi:UDP-N-acetylglucosamine 1-carboxyvinyltransferase